MAECCRREQLVEKRLNFGLEEGVWHKREKRLEVVLYKVHDDKDSVTEKARARGGVMSIMP